MPNNPIQVVLSADQLRGQREAHPGGSAKDFFRGKNEDFIKHRARVHEQVSAVRSALMTSGHGGVGYATVALRPEAVAKSHRPVGALFPPARTPIVGSNEVGELIVEVTPEALEQVEAAVARTELEPRLVEDKRTGRLKEQVTRARSEVGAISDVSLWDSAKRRRFSAQEALEWLIDSRTGGFYHVELFDTPEGAQRASSTRERKATSWQTFARGLHALGAGLSAIRVATHPTPLIEIRLSDTDAEPIIWLEPEPWPNSSSRLPAVNTDVERHEALLRFLDTHPLVRSIQLAPKLKVAGAADAETGRHVTRGVAAQSGLTPSPTSQSGAGYISAIDTGSSVADAVTRRGDGPYPIVGVIDGGIGQCLDTWVRERYQPIADEHRSEEHGTFIGGLLVAGQSLNGPQIVPEPDGCDLVDLAMFPRRTDFDEYYNGALDFVAAVNEAIGDVRTRVPVRIFNFSINDEARRADPTTYSVLATQLDEIADRHDVIFVISAGNIHAGSHRPEWSEDAQVTLQGLAAPRDDALSEPAESARNVSVAALNPPGHPSCVALAPAAYSRRGPGMASGVKPDLAHIGGSSQAHATCGHGLASTSPQGTIASDFGTSYAAPQVAKALATLDASIAGDVPRETLLALLIHHSAHPAPVSSKPFAAVARDLVGFGLPRTAAEMLETPDHTVTLVFHSRMEQGHELTFEFAWPTALVNAAGSCRGDVRLTLVARPPLDSRFRSELARVNLDATLRQEQPDGTYLSRLGETYMQGAGGRSARELQRIKEGLKWSAVKTYARRMPKGIGASSNWQLRVSYVLREQAIMPEAGVPFTVVLTITDPAHQAPVFQQLRQSLVAAGVPLADIRTYTTVVQHTQG